MDDLSFVDGHGDGSGEFFFVNVAVDYVVYACCNLWRFGL